MRDVKAMTRHLFVYGTLRRMSQHPMARFLAERASFVSEGTVPGKLYNLGRFPGMTEPAALADRVVGDVFHLGDGDDTIEELDRYEGAESPLPSFFERGLADVTLGDGRVVRALVYWFRGTVAETQRIESGDYRQMLAITPKLS